MGAGHGPMSEHQALPPRKLELGQWAWGQTLPYGRQMCSTTWDRHAQCLPAVRLMENRWSLPVLGAQGFSSWQCLSAWEQVFSTIPTSSNTHIHSQKFMKKVKIRGRVLSTRVKTELKSKHQNSDNNEVKQKIISIIFQASLKLLTYLG